MEKFLMQHSVKLQLATAVGIIGSIIYFAFTASGFVGQIHQNSEDISNIKTYTSKVIILETRFGDMQDDVAEIKGDIKTLLKTK